MVKKTLLIFFTISYLSVFAQEVRVTAATDTTDYLVGDHIRYSLTIETDNDVYIINPFFRDSLKNIDVLSISEPVVTEGTSGKKILYDAVLSRYDSSEVTIPSVRIEYRTKTDTTLKTVLSNPVTFRVHSVKVSMQEDIKDIKAPIRPLDIYFILYILMVLAAISMLAYYFIYRKYWKKGPETIVPKEKEKILSHQLAFRKLDQLEKEHLWQNGYVKEYHSRITEIIREYFEIQFNLPALEMTTTDSLKVLSQHNQGIKVLDITSRFLNNADLVKFAKYQPLGIVNLEMMSQAREIITKTVSVQKEIEIEKDTKEVLDV